jgi:tetratricopeptide (TPR) repeat protein
VVIVVIAYANSLDGPFFVDDLTTIADNTTIHDWHHLRDLVVSSEETPVTSRPVVALTFAVNYALGGETVLGYHIVNVAIHLVVVLLLFGVVRELLELPRVRTLVATRATVIAFAVAALWAVHPLNTEAVDYVTQRTESLMALFYLATVYAGVRTLSSWSGRWSAAAVVCCAAGMACKESMVTAPLAVLLVDWLLISGSVATALRTHWRLYLGLVATWPVLGALVALAPHTRSAGFVTFGNSWTYLLNQSVMIVRYLRLAIWPTSLVVNYGWPRPVTLADVWPKAVVVMALLGATIVGLWRQPALGCVGAWFFLTLAPTSSVMPIATEVGAERRMYVPLMALLALVVVGSVALWGGLSARRPSLRACTGAVAWSTLAALLTLLIAGTVLRNREYRSALTLAQTTVERWPSSVAEHVLGTEWVFAGNKAEARRHFQRAVPGAPRAYYSLALVEFDDEEWPAAIRDFRTFIDVQPLLLDVRLARLYLAQALERESQWADAIEQCRLVLSMHPTRDDALDAQLFWADALRGEGNYDAALARYQTYVQARPDDVRGANGVGISLVGLGRSSGAVPWFVRAADLSPTDGAVQKNAAMALEETARFDEAARYASRAVTLRPNDAESRDVWAQALIRQGQLAEAILQFEIAVRLDPSAVDIRSHLAQARGVAGH